jgi:hypothetical protein
MCLACDNFVTYCECWYSLTFVIVIFFCVYLLHILVFKFCVPNIGPLCYVYVTHYCSKNIGKPNDFVTLKRFWWWCVSIKIMWFLTFIYNLLLWTEWSVSEMVCFHPWIESWRGTWLVWCPPSFHLRMEMSSFISAKTNVLFLWSPFKASKWAERGKTVSHHVLY